VPDDQHTPVGGLGARAQCEHDLGVRDRAIESVSDQRRTGEYDSVRARMKWLDRFVQIMQQQMRTRRKRLSWKRCTRPMTPSGTRKRCRRCWRGPSYPTRSALRSPRAPSAGPRPFAPRPPESLCRIPRSVRAGYPTRQGLVIHREESGRS